MHDVGWIVSSQNSYVQVLTPSARGTYHSQRTGQVFKDMIKLKWGG